MDQFFLINWLNLKNRDNKIITVKNKKLKHSLVKIIKTLKLF
jgi:hypothetical protein